MGGAKVGYWFTEESLILFFFFYLGTLIVSPTVHLAFDETYYLERACTNIMLTLSSVGGQESKLKVIFSEIKSLSFHFPPNFNIPYPRH